jgi:hypothetical protein
MANNVKFKSPALPIPPAQYNQSLYQRTFSILRLYFNQLDEHLRQDLGDTTINGDLTVTGGVTAGDTTVNGALTVNNDLASIISTDAGAGAAPVFELYRNSASPADEDLVGQIQFQGENDADEKYLYASISGKISDATNNSENGTLEFNVGAGGSMLTIATIDQTRGVDTGSYGIRGGYFVIGSDSAYAPNNVINGGLTINNFGSNDNLELVDTNSSNTNSDPRVSFYRDSSSPADNDHAGRIEFYANNDADQKTNTAGILNRILDVTDGTEDGELTFSVMQAGTSNTLLTLDPNGVTATGATTVNGALTVNDDVMEVVSTDAGATAKPVLKLTRNSSSPADNDVLGAVEFHGENSAGTDVVYGKMDCVIVDEGTGVSGNYVKGQIRFSTAKGSFNGFSPLEEPSLTIDSTGIYIGNENATGSTTALRSYYHLYYQQGFKSFSSSKTYNTLVTFDAPTADRSIKIPDVGGTVVVAGMAGGDINGGAGAGSPKTAWSLAEFQANPNVLYTHYNASNSNDLVVAVPFAGVDIGSEKYGNRYIFTNVSPAGSEIVIDLDGFTFSGTQYYATTKYDGGTNAIITSASSNLVVAAGGTIELIPVTGGIFVVQGIGYS